MRWERRNSDFLTGYRVIRYRLYVLLRVTCIVNREMNYEFCRKTSEQLGFFIYYIY